QQLINYERMKPGLEAARTLGRACIERIGMNAVRKKDAAAARKYLEAGFGLGSRMYEERLTCDELGAGLGVMGGGAEGMGMWGVVFGWGECDLLLGMEGRRNNGGRGGYCRSWWGIRMSR